MSTTVVLAKFEWLKAHGVITDEEYNAGTELFAQQLREVWTQQEKRELIYTWQSQLNELKHAAVRGGLNA